MSAQQSLTIVDYHPGSDAYDAGWYIVYLETDGTCYDAIGPYDTEAEANRVLKEAA
jgi:hypothetical protein